MTRPYLQAPRRAQRSLGVLCVSLVIAAPAFAQVPVVAYDGSEIFCHILRHFRFQPIRGIQELAEHKPEETLIVLFGNLEALDAIRKQMPDLDACAVLIASDRRSGSYQRAKDVEWRWVESRLTPWRLKIDGSEVGVPGEVGYQQKSRCPLLTQAEISRHHPLFRGIDTGIATNGPSVLASDQSDLHLLARFPVSARSGQASSFLSDHEHAGYVFGSSAESDQRVLILAGHGVFINGMIVQNDNDNGLFAVNTVRWLRDGPNGKRKYALMIHDGKVIDSFDLPLTGLPPVPIPPVRVINRLLRELENEGIVHRFLEEVVGWPWVVRFGLIVATLGLFVYGVWRLFPARHSLEAVPLLIGMQAPAASQRSVMQQRQLELLWRDNLWEPAQALARQWFLDNAHVDPPLWDQAHTATPPAGQFRSGWWTRHKLAQLLAVVWQNAVSDPARPVRLREFRKLAEAVQSLNQALLAGQLAFASGKSAKG